LVGSQSNQQVVEIDNDLIKRHRPGRPTTPDQVSTRRHFARAVAQNMLDATPEPISVHGPSALPPHGKSHAGSIEVSIESNHHPEHFAAQSPTIAANCREISGIPTTIDQALSRWRPLRRRAFTMPRPALVDMRCRKPCLRARRRLLGWNVRFTEISEKAT